MTAGLPVGIAAWLRVPVRFFLTFLLLATSVGANAASTRVSVSVSSPTTRSSYTTSSATIALTGTASASSGISRVSWQNSNGGATGVATGTGKWSVSGISLSPGYNRITVTGYSNSGGSGRNILTVSYRPTTTSTPTTPTTPTVADTAAPSAPVSPNATASSSSQINLSWGAASDNVGVTGYRIERCLGASCTSFAQIATTGGTSVGNTGLASGTTYRYRVRAADAAGNLGGYSAIAAATTSSAASAVTTNRPPVISGSPAKSVVAGAAYAFTPTASDPDGQKLTFSVMGAPSWASFSSTTGKLSGTPGAGNVGLTEGIVITVSDGAAYASLPAFSLAVVQVATGSATISWLPPTQRTDGSALTNLAGYHIKYGTNSAALDRMIVVNGAGLTSYVVEGLTAGKWYFGISAFDSAGLESNNSNIGSKTIP